MLWEIPYTLDSPAGSVTTLKKGSGIPRIRKSAKKERQKSRHDA
jgi:hypothetical protein